MVTSLLEKLGPTSKRIGPGQWLATCPVHEDQHNSLSVGVGDLMDRVLVSCRAGCRTEEVLSALGLKFADLHGKPGGMMSGHGSGTRNLALWSKVYPYFLAELGLSERHRGDLRGRGLSDSQIHAHGYRSIQPETLDMAIAETVRDLGEQALLDTPGFERDGKGKVTTTVQGGLCIPVMTVPGQIRAVKVRLDEERQEGGKYVWFSGGRGGSVGAPCHVPLTSVPGILERKRVRIVEGPLKANVCVALTGVATIGIPGAGLWKSCLPVLERYRPDEVLLTFDNDWRENRGVRASRYDLSRECQKMGIRAVHYEDWEADLKGLDDVLAAGEKYSVKAMGLDQ